MAVPSMQPRSLSTRLPTRQGCCRLKSRPPRVVPRLLEPVAEPEEDTKPQGRAAWVSTHAELSLCLLQRRGVAAYLHPLLPPSLPQPYHQSTIHEDNALPSSPGGPDLVRCTFLSELVSQPSASGWGSLLSWQALAPGLSDPVAPSRSATIERDAGRGGSGINGTSTSYVRGGSSSSPSLCDTPSSEWSVKGTSAGALAPLARQPRSSQAARNPYSALDAPTLPSPRGLSLTRQPAASHPAPAVASAPMAAPGSSRGSSAMQLCDPPALPVWELGSLRGQVLLPVGDLAVSTSCSSISLEASDPPALPMRQGAPAGVPQPPGFQQEPALESSLSLGRGCELQLASHLVASTSQAGRAPISQPKGVQRKLPSPAAPPLQASPQALAIATSSPGPDLAASTSRAVTTAAAGLDLVPPLSRATPSPHNIAGSTSLLGHRDLVPGIPQPILVISVVSACLTLSSCVFNTLLPIYMVAELKMTMRSMGVFEGLMEAFAYLVRMFSGVVSDMMTSRKAAITAGFAMGAAAKFGMSGATEVGTLFASKVVDRLANGVQAAPRDALISDLAPATSRSSCFGFAQSLRKWGSAAGALLAYFLMRASGNDYQLIFKMAASVSLASCLAFVLLVPSHARPLQGGSREAAGKAVEARASRSGRMGYGVGNVLKDMMSMGSGFYRMLLVVALYCSAHINESLLEARAIEVGFSKADSTLVIFCLSMTIFVAAWPLGRLDDRCGPSFTFAVGMLAHIAADAVLMCSAAHPWALFAALGFMGVHMSVMNGPLLANAVSHAPPRLRGTAFGMFYTVMAVVALSANSAYGALWHAFGAWAAFGASAALSMATLLALPTLLPDEQGGREVAAGTQQPLAAPA